MRAVVQRVLEAAVHISGAEHAAIGTGPVDATYKAIDAVIHQPATLLEFVIHAVTEGIDALGEVTVRIQGDRPESSLDAQSEVDQPRTYGGYGADTDIIVASAKAYLSALNKILVANGMYAAADQTIPETAQN